MGPFAHVAALASYLLLANTNAFRVKHRKASRTQQLNEAKAEPFNAKLYAVNQQKPGFPGAHANIKVGLAIGGGGSRAMSWSMGVLRALEHLGLMGKFDALSTVSGGTWIGAPYMFQTRYSLNEFWGPMTNPSNLTLTELYKKSARLGDISDSDTTAKLVLMKLLYPDNEVWERLMSEVFMDRFNLGERENMYMAGSEEHRSDIIRRNPQLSKSQFHVPVPNRPKVFIMGGIVTAPTGYDVPTGFTDSMPFQMSPDICGTSVWPNYTAGEVKPMHFPGGWFKKDIDTIMGGGFIETFAHGSREPPVQSRSGDVSVQMTGSYKTMSLTSAVAISSAPIFRPRRYTWPVTPEGKTQGGTEFEYSDGGICENTGLFALLQRKASHVVQIISSSVKNDVSIDWCKTRSAEEWRAIHETCDSSTCQLSSMFGYKYKSYLSNYYRNKVFPTERAQPFFCKIQTLIKAGKPVVFAETFPVIGNQWYGIESGFEVKVLFVVLEVSTGFENTLPASMQEEMRSNSLFSSHPHYHLFMEHGDVIELKRPIANLLAAQAEYSVLQNEGLFRDFLR